MTTKQVAHLVLILSNYPIGDHCWSLEGTSDFLVDIGVPRILEVCDIENLRRLHCIVLYSIIDRPQFRCIPVGCPIHVPCIEFLNYFWCFVCYSRSQIARLVVFIATRGRRRHLRQWCPPLTANSGLVLQEREKTRLKMTGMLKRELLYDYFEKCITGFLQGFEKSYKVLDIKYGF